jgi:peptidoglycan/LPS O-acetylase OafA/YrhL
MYFKNLDSPRFFAFLVVFLEHIVFTHDSALRNSPYYLFYREHFSTIGVLGWDFYMVLSGFLITWIIIEERLNTSGFNLLHFWLKRCLRIWPLYFLMIFVGLALNWASLHFLGKEISDVPPLSWLLTFTLNFYLIGHGQNFFFFLVFFWSISVEEQCYMLWGITLKWFKKALVPLCILMLAGSLVFRMAALHQPSNLYFNSLSWAGNFACGGLLAYFCIRRKEWLAIAVKIPPPLSIVVYLLFIVNIVFFARIYASPFMTVLERIPAMAFFCFLIFEQCFSQNPIFRLGSVPFLNYLGRISYGLFCYHGLVILFYEKITEGIGWINQPAAVFLVNPIIIFALTIGIAAISYKYFERPIMHLRKLYHPA